MKKIRGLLVLLIMSLALILTGCDFLNEDELGENEVKVLNSESTFVGTNYESVVEKLQDWGFTNIETVAVYDIFWGITKPGTTKTVTIDSSRDFRSGSIFDKDVSIIVIYSMPMDDDPAKQKFTITWKNEDGSTLKTDSVLVGTIPTYGGSQPTKPASNEVKYVFNGWTPEIEEVTENKTYTATYIEVDNLFTITFNLDGGHWDLENTQSVIYNGLITSDVPSKDGYDFDGWVIKGFIFDTAFNPSTNIKQDYTLTATWTEAKHIVSFDLNGGTWSRSNEQMINHNGVITTTKPTKDGYDFVGWSIDGSTFDPASTVTSDLNLKAEWYLPNYEDILIGRWETRDLGMKGKGFSFLEFDGSFYDSNGERKSGVTDFNHNWGSFTLYGNKIGFYFVDQGTVYFTITYSNGILTMKNKDYIDIVMYQTENEPNSLDWKWYHLYEFAKTQSDLKTDQLGNYYEIDMNSIIRNLSPNNKLVESNNQTIKIYSHKVINITINYTGVNDSSIEMIVNLIFSYNDVTNTIIKDPFIHIESEGYVMFAQEGSTTIEFDEGINLFLFTTTEVNNYGNQFPVGSTFDLMSFTETALYEAADYLLSKHGIYLFTI